MLNDVKNIKHQERKTKMSYRWKSSNMMLSLVTIMTLLQFTNGWMMQMQNGEISLSPPPPPPTTTTTTTTLYSKSISSQCVIHRRQFLLTTLTTASTAAGLTLTQPKAAVAAGKRYVLNEETGDYDEIEDPDWQTEWKSRLDKIQSMSQDEVFMAARGAGNVDLQAGESSAPNKKRRALAGCRDEKSRKKVAGGNGIDEKTCTSRVLNGEVDFILESI